MPVIVAVEGPSAPGKTTWCRATGEQFVAEYSPTGQEPDGFDPAGQATYWAQVNAQRWSQALALEAATGVAVCDSDPLKLHYSWCLAAAPITRFEHELTAVRQMFTQRRLGFADVVLLSIPDPQQLLRQRTEDPLGGAVISTCMPASPHRWPSMQRWIDSTRAASSTGSLSSSTLPHCLRRARTATTGTCWTA